MPSLYCVEIGIRERKNLCRMIASVVVVADTPDRAVEYVERHYPEALRHAAVQRIFEARHVVVDWPSGEVAITEKTPEL